MKKSNYKTYLTQSLLALTVVGGMTACAEEVGMFDAMRHADSEGLSIKPTVSEARLVTRAASVEELNEKALNTLDVFVEHVTDGNGGDGTFLRQYHLVGTAQTPIQELMNNFLAERWRAEGLEIGQNYNIYVATNNTQTKDEKDLTTFDVEALKGLVADEVTDGLAVVDEASNNIAWPWTEQFANTPSGNIYKQYVPESGADAVKVNNNLYGFTTEKEFMMDGIRENWTPDATTLDQVFDDVTLNRAAAKIVLNVKFDATFLKTLTQNMTVNGTDTTWTNKPAAEQVSITDAPAWRFYNFAFGAPVFAPETQGAGVEVHNSATLLRHPYEFAGDDKHFQIITYTYPNKWAAVDYATKAPSLVVSVPYLQNGASQPDYHYYRIPLVKSDVTAIERNHIYVINATIATRGSELHEDEDVIEDVIYNVLHWNDETNSQAIHNEVQSVQHYYFNVNPKVYTLRGDGDQSVVLNYSKASGTKVNWALFTYDEDGNQTAVVDNDDANAIRAWFYNSDGTFITTYRDTGSGINWSNMGVNIVQSTEVTSGSAGTVTVTSTALTNKAIKYIRLRVYLDEPDTFDANGNPTMYEDIIIRHFPTDNVQNIVGSWSSYHTTDGGTQQVTLTTRSLTEAQSWAEQYGVSFTTEEINTTDYITFAEYTAHSSEEGYTMNGPTSITRNAFLNAVPNNNNRRAANSQANAVADASEGHSYYWGTGIEIVATNVRIPNNYTYDYYTNGTQNNRYNVYRYSEYYTASYTHTYSYTQYSMTVEMASTGNWVDWERDAYQTYYSGNYKYTRGNNFTAKVYDESRNRIYAIEPDGDIRYNQTWGGGYYTFSYLTYGIADNYTQGSYYVYSTDGTIGTAGGMDLTNNHMYVIQISSTSDDYVLGRPVKGNPSANQSYDDVVSPAFMIASQLGAVTQFTGENAATNAANHCDQYMEVASDGTRYTGWRLPTQSEIGIISRYQNGNINNVTIPADYRPMAEVLGGELYWCLSGRRIRTADNQVVDTGNAYLRCVRDLSAAEVERLNGFEKIQEKYSNQ